MPRKSARAQQVYRVHAELVDGPLAAEFRAANPRISRTVEVTGDHSLEHLHAALQEALGGEPAEPYYFELGLRFLDDANTRYASGAHPMSDNSWEKGKAALTWFSRLKPAKGQVLWYVYRRLWLYRLKVEAVAEPETGAQYPRLARKVGENPPEPTEELRREYGHVADEGDGWVGGGTDEEEWDDEDFPYDFDEDDLDFGPRDWAWQEVLVLREDRTPAERSVDGPPLADHIRGGADLRIGTTFRHNEHIDVSSPSDEIVFETADFPVTYLLDDRWVAGIMTSRHPVELPEGFGERPSMSFFLYNEDGAQAIARPYLDARPAPGTPGRSADTAPPAMPRYRVTDTWDADTRAPSQNLVYQFADYHFYARGEWEPVYVHGADGRALPQIDNYREALLVALAEGRSCKIGFHELCDDLAGPEGGPLHTVFVETNSTYIYSEQKLAVAASNLVVRVRPAIPLAYTSGGWDFGWLLARSDGRVTYRRCDPYTRQFSDHQLRLAMTWFVR